MFVFAHWLKRIHQNLPRLGALGVKYDPAAKSGCVLSPFKGEIKPIQDMQDAYRASDPTADLTDPTDWLLCKTNKQINGFSGAQ